MKIKLYTEVMHVISRSLNAFIGQFPKVINGWIWNDDSYFDLVISLNTFHNLYNYELADALREFERVGKEHKYLCVESYRNESEKVNLLYWQGTCEAFCTPKEWEWWFEYAEYSGDHSFIYFE